MTATRWLSLLGLLLMVASSFGGAEWVRVGQEPTAQAAPSPEHYATKSSTSAEPQAPAEHEGNDSALVGGTWLELGAVHMVGSLWQRAPQRLVAAWHTPVARQRAPPDISA